MFGQVVRGRTQDPAAVREALEAWTAELSPESGWLGTTAGVTEDGRFVAAVRFESEQAARRAGSRPGRGRWYDVLDGPVTVTDGSRTETFSHVDPDRARFVQVVQGRVSDLDEAWRLNREMEVERAVFLPCLLGTVTIGHQDGRFTRVLCFSTEEGARAGEREGPKPRRQAEAARLIVGPLEFLDLRDPWLFEPG